MGETSLSQDRISPVVYFPPHKHELLLQRFFEMEGVESRSQNRVFGGVVTRGMRDLRSKKRGSKMERFIPFDEHASRQEVGETRCRFPSAH